MLDNRACGVLMPVSSLPGNTGIGTFGADAYAFVDFLARAKQTYWQILPLNPTGYGDSPYQSVSTFAGNPYFIDLRLLAEDGFLTEREIESVPWGNDPKKVDYALVFRGRRKLFSLVYERFFRCVPVDFDAFCSRQALWLQDYALFMAVKDAQGGLPFTMWQPDIRLRRSLAVKHWRRECGQRIRYYQMLQYLFFRQWSALKAYANAKGIFIIGDIPIYVAEDSADVWANRSLFQLDAQGRPVEVAGCPPDDFSADGQLWGNPVYNWHAMKRSGYAWWLRRLDFSMQLYDVLRIDHFRAFDSYYCIPAVEKTAKRGVWRRGPGMDFFAAVEQQLGKMPVIAEDLGFLTDSVKKLLADCGFPGMKVLQFAYDSREDNDYLPTHYPPNCVVYTGTHDNDTILGWASHAPEQDVKRACKALGAKKRADLPWKMMDEALNSRANTCILTMQDLLELGSQGRMNTPATLGGNWRWRAKENDIKTELADKLARHTRRSGRC